jgi:DnaJ-class molecular chaperone
MRTRKEIECGIHWDRASGPYVDDMNASVNLNLENVMQNQGLILEVLLDVRDLLSEKREATGARYVPSVCSICPVCLGSGKISSGLGQTGTIPFEKTCYGCGGKGWVSVSGKEERK